MNILTSPTQQDAITFFALFACIIALITWTAIIALEAFEKNRNVWVIIYSILGLLVTSWFTVGFAISLMGTAVVPSEYFRPMLPLLITLFTTGGVLVYRGKTQHDTIIRLQHTNINLKEQIERYDDGPA